MRCLVTGAAGFIGSSLCDRLLSAGHTVRGIDCFVDYYPRSVKEVNLLSARGFNTFEFVEANLLTVDMQPLLDGVQWVFHQAAQAGVRASWGQSFESYCSNNILATQRLLEHVKRQREILRLVFASSSSVYGDAEVFPTAESVTPRPVSPYGVTKLAAEHLMSLYARESGVPAVSLRYFTVYGPRQRPDMAFRRFIEAALQGREIVVYGDGSQSRDFTFVDDIVDANLLSAERGSAGQVLNIGGGTQATINQVLDILGSFLGPLRVKKVERQLGDARHTSADTSLAVQSLGYKPKIGLADGIQREIDWLKQSLERC